MTTTTTSFSKSKIMFLKTSSLAGTFLLFWAALLATSSSALSEKTDGKALMCYFGSWSTYRWSTGRGDQTEKCKTYFCVMGTIGKKVFKNGVRTHFKMPIWQSNSTNWILHKPKMAFVTIWNNRLANCTTIFFRPFWCGRYWSFFVHPFGVRICWSRCSKLHHPCIRPLQWIGRKLGKRRI